MRNVTTPETTMATEKTAVTSAKLPTSTRQQAEKAPNQQPQGVMPGKSATRQPNHPKLPDVQCATLCMRQRIATSFSIYPSMTASSKCVKKAFASTAWKKVTPRKRVPTQGQFAENATSQTIIHWYIEEMRSKIRTRCHFNRWPKIKAKTLHLRSRHQQRRLPPPNQPRD